MARRVQDSALETRTARLKLAIKPEPYWRGLDQGLHIGYRRRKTGGSWTARRRQDDGKYVEAKIGAADDILNADDLKVFTFHQAQAKARNWSSGAVLRDAGLDEKRSGPYLVSHAIEDYEADYERRGGKALADLKGRINAFILPELGNIKIDSLTAQRIKNWHTDLAQAPVRLRTRPGNTQQVKELADDADSTRKRRATANRTLTVLKAALNHAFHEGKVASDAAWRRVKPYREVDAAKIRYLTPAECKRLVKKTDKVFRPMVQAALLTGCRYGELANLKVSDFDAKSQTVIIRTSKSGKARHVVLTDEGVSFFKTITNQKGSTINIFTKEDGKPWGKSHQHRPLQAACTAAEISPAVSFHILRHTYGSTLAMSGAPLQVIAKNMGHADTRMTEKHYAHFAPSYVAETIRANMPVLGIVSKSKRISKKP